MLSSVYISIKCIIISQVIYIITVIFYAKIIIYEYKILNNDFFLNCIRD